MDCEDCDQTALMRGLIFAGRARIAKNLELPAMDSKNWTAPIKKRLFGYIQAESWDTTEFMNGEQNARMALCA